MKLEDIFKDYDDEDGIDYFIIEINQDDLDELGVLEEGIWKREGLYGKRLDAADPENNITRHVHVAKWKHRNAKSHQASWNEDGSRHDKKTFNSKVSNLSAVKKIASKALGIESDLLESLTPKLMTFREYQLITESEEQESLNIKIFKFKK